MALKRKSVLAGYKLLTRSADRSISVAVMGQRGWAGICLAGAAIGAYDICSVDMTAMLFTGFDGQYIMQYIMDRQKRRFQISFDCQVEGKKAVSFKLFLKKRVGIFTIT